MKIKYYISKITTMAIHKMQNLNELTLGRVKVLFIEPNLFEG